jgi:hypothetical protein
MYHPASSGINAGEIVAKDTSNKYIIVATASTNKVDVLGVAANDAASAAGWVEIIPIRGQLWEWDCTNATAATHLYITHLLTNAATVNNTTSDANSAYATVTAVNTKTVGTIYKQQGFINAGHKVA